MKVLVFLAVLVAAALGAPDGRIVGGQDAQRYQFPFQVSVQYCISGTCQHACGGVIISQSWVATAAHCLTEAPGLGSYQILAGVINLRDDGPDRAVYSVSHAFIHPSYQGGLNPHDIAIIKLAAPLVFNSAVQAATLPRQGQEFELEGVLIGWGSIGGSETPIMPQTLQYAYTPVVPILQCRAALDALLGNTPHPLDNDSNICTGPLTGGVSTCTGDSGGALIQPALEVTLIGIASWGLSPCGLAGAPSVHTKISHYINWIRYHVDDLN